MSASFETLALQTVGAEAHGFHLSPLRLFHGTPLDNVPEITRGGLRFFAHEPCFTIDPSVAVCKYAHFGYSHSTVHGGQALARARQLVADGLIPPQPDDTALIREACAFWDGQGGMGRLLVVELDPAEWIAMPSVMGAVAVNPARREVRGGLTKWLETHIALMPRTSDPGQLAAFQSGFARGALWLDPAWRDQRQRVNLPPQAVARPIVCDAYLLDYLRRFARDPLGGCAGLTPPAALAEAFPGRDPAAIAEHLRTIRLGTDLRRLALSLLRRRGFTMVKTDVPRPLVEPKSIFWEDAYLDWRIEATAAFARSDSHLRHGQVQRACAALDVLAHGAFKALPEAFAQVDQATAALNRMAVEDQALAPA